MALGAARFKPSCGFSGGGKFGADCDELRAEIVAGARDTAFHGADVEVKRSPDLLVGLILDVAQRENFTVARIESSHARFDERGKFDAGVFLRGVGRVGRDEFREGRIIFLPESAIQRERRVSAATEKIPVAIAREVDGDAVQPRRKRGITAETREAAVRADKRILSDLFGVGAVAQQAEGGGENFYPMALHDFNERGLVAGVETLDEGRVVVARGCVWSEGGVRGRGLVLGLGRGWGIGVVHAVGVTLARASEI